MQGLRLLLCDEVERLDRATGLPYPAWKGGICD